MYSITLSIASMYSDSSHRRFLLLYQLMRIEKLIVQFFVPSCAVARVIMVSIIAFIPKGSDLMAFRIVVCRAVLVWLASYWVVIVASIDENIVVDCWVFVLCCFSRDKYLGPFSLSRWAMHTSVTYHGPHYCSRVSTSHCVSSILPAPAGLARRPHCAHCSPNTTTG